MPTDDPTTKSTSQRLPPIRRRVWRPRFTLTGLLLLMVVACTTAAGGNYLRGALSGGTSGRVVFVIFTLTAPVVLLSVMSIIALITRPRRRRK